MKKQKMLGIGNDGTFNHYTFRKTRLSIRCLEQALSKFDIFLDYRDLLPKSKKAADKVMVKRLTDVHTHTGHNIRAKMRVDIFFGSKKMFLTVMCNQKTRKNLNDTIFEYFELVEPKESEPKFSKKSNK